MKRYLQSPQSLFVVPLVVPELGNLFVPNPYSPAGKSTIVESTPGRWQDLISGTVYAFTFEWLEAELIWKWSVGETHYGIGSAGTEESPVTCAEWSTASGVRAPQFIDPNGEALLVRVLTKANGPAVDVLPDDLRRKGPANIMGTLTGEVPAAGTLTEPLAYFGSSPIYGITIEGAETIADVEMIWIDGRWPTIWNDDGVPMAAQLIWPNVFQNPPA